ASIEHSLVNDGLVRQARHIEHAALRDRGCLDRILDPPADDVKFALKAKLIVDAERGRGGGVFTADENLADDRLNGLGRGTERRVVGWHRPPAEQGVAFFPHDLLEQLLALLAVVSIAWQEDHADAILAV